MLKILIKYPRFHLAGVFMGLGVICLLCCPWPVLSQDIEQPDTGQSDSEPQKTAAGLTRLHITADNLVANQNTQHIIFSGHVIALYDGKKITSEKLQVFYDDQAGTVPMDTVDNSGIKKIIASENVEIVFEDKTGLCDQAVYVAATNSIVLTGKVVRLQSQTSYITGSKITIFQDSGQIIVDGDNGKRVNAVFQPEEKHSIADQK